LEEVSTDSDHAKAIAERVSRRVGGKRADAPREPAPRSTTNGAPVNEELSAIRAGLHDLESKLDRIESKVGSAAPSGPPTRARVIDFVSASPPAPGSSSISTPPPAVTRAAAAEFVPATQSPWLRDLMTMDHPSQERFGVEEATVAELVEFFESEKKCSIEAGDKPCDHCSMCSSRGF